eukprot:TRINITY_DN5086_c0_g1_i7.p1 TRINITY_DN5086_c0_g1~~TRINITY_DN5086_c0_g1_i7.p1  ORF type:complete len:388 (-),score=104.82 TRINITY_DN5086_c0_g1_i7:155-1318(-)
MTYHMFEDCMFELADLWCEGVTVDDYVGFLEGLYKQVVLAKGGACSALQCWHAMRHVLDAPKIMQASVEDTKNGVVRATEDQEKLCKGMAADINSMIGKSRHKTSNRKGKKVIGATVVEMQAFLQGTCYGPFSQWLFRDGLKNFNRFQKSGKGRLDPNELQKALTCFITSDGLGRELERKIEADADKPKPRSRSKTSMPGSRVTSSVSSAAHRRANSTKSAGPQRGGKDPRVTPRHVGGLTSRNTTMKPVEAIAPPNTNGKRWWLHMKMVSKCYVSLLGMTQAPPEVPHFAKSALLIDNDQIEEATKVFEKFDTEDTGFILGEQFCVALQSLHPDKGRSGIRVAVQDLMEEHGMELTEDRAVDLNEFLKVHNSLAMDQIDFDNVEFF